MQFEFKIQCVSQPLGICLAIDFKLITQNVELADILHPDGGVPQSGLENLINMSQI